MTFFPALEACTPGELDNDRYGIVVRSLERPGWMGGALPRMPGILNEWNQYHHARINNAQLVSFEPHVIYRHDVVKAVESGAAWQPSGVPAPSEPRPLTRAGPGGKVAARARDLACVRLFGSKARTDPLADDLVPADVDSIYVSIYIGGHMRGCQGVAVRSLDDDVTRLVEAALGDERFEAQKDDASPDSVAVSVSFLHDRLDLGAHSIAEIVRRIRHGRQALMVTQRNRCALFLPSVASRFNLSPVSFVEELNKAEIDKPPYRWTRFECATWLADRAGERIMEGSFAPEDPPAQLSDLVDRLVPLAVDYLLRHQRPDGTFHTRYEPLTDQLYAAVDLPRLAHAAWVLARAARIFSHKSAGEAAERTVQFLLRITRKTADGIWLKHEDPRPSVAENAFLLLALCEASPSSHWAPRLAAVLWDRIDVHGRVHTHQDAATATDAFQDYFPGQAMLSLARAVSAGVTSVDEGRLTRALRYYRHRFRSRPHFGQVSWLTQACHAWWRVTGERAFAELAFEIVDWIRGFQQEKSGGFINDHQPDTPGFTSALYLEAMGAAASLARSLGDALRHAAYLEACRRGLQFLDGLIIQPRDSTILPNPAFAIGGLRRSAQRTEICVDFVQHYLAAVLEVRRAMQSDEE